MKPISNLHIAKLNFVGLRYVTQLFMSLVQFSPLKRISNCQSFVKGIWEEVETKK